MYKLSVARTCALMLPFLTLALLAISPDVSQAQDDPPETMSVVGVSVLTPKNQQIVKDEAVTITGILRLRGITTKGGSYSSKVNITRPVTREVIDPDTGMATVETFDTLVKQVTVTVALPPGTEHIGGHGVGYEFSAVVEANPHWLEGKTYNVKGAIVDGSDKTGSFTVVPEVEDDEPPIIGILGIFF